MCAVEQKAVFRELTGDDPEPEVTEIESLCVNCFANGKTRLLLTRIPYYKNVVLMSFSCENCGFENNEVQPGGAYAETGIRWTLSVEQPEDLNRQVVKSDHCCIRIPLLDFEIPAQSQKGEVTTVEGIISRAASGLSQAMSHQDQSRTTELTAVVHKLNGLKELRQPWVMEIEDISGNSFVENPVAPSRDPRCTSTTFKRTEEQDHRLGIFSKEEVSSPPAEPPGSTEAPSEAPTEAPEGSYDRIIADEVLQFRTNCPDCNAPADTNMKITRIPHFKEVVIMATVCDACGHRTNEVKSGGGVEEQGVRIEVRVAGPEDFSRDILKSETCNMEIPELELEVGGRALGGRFSTAEGVIRATVQQLQECPGVAGDAPGVAKERLDKFLEKLEEVLSGKRAVTLILDDPAGNSFAQSLNDDGTPDDGLKITRYTRSFEQNDELGLNDMRVEGYEPV